MLLPPQPQQLQRICLRAGCSSGPGVAVMPNWFATVYGQGQSSVRPASVPTFAEMEIWRRSADQLPGR